MQSEHSTTELQPLNYTGCGGEVGKWGSEEMGKNYSTDKSTPFDRFC